MGLIRNKAFLFIVTTLLATASIVIFYPIRQQPIDDEFISAITDEIPAYLHNGSPIIEIASVSRHNIKWYVVTIRSTKDVDTVVPVRTVFKQTYNDLVMVVKPTTYFTEADEQKSDAIPESVILELRK